MIDFKNKHKILRNFLVSFTHLTSGYGEVVNQCGFKVVVLPGSNFL